MPYDIPIRADALDALISKFERLSGAIDTADQKVKGLNGSVGGSGGGTPMGGSSPAVVADREERINRRIINTGTGQSRIPMVSGPYGRRGYYAQALRNAESTGDQDAIKDAKLRQEANEKRIARAENPRSSSNPMLDMLLTSRYDPTSGKLYPLVSRALAARQLGTEGLAGAMTGAGLTSAQAAKLAPVVAAAATAAMPILIAGGVMAVAAGAGLAMMDKQANLARDMRMTMLAGGTSMESGALMGLYGPGGGQMALGVADALRQGTYGATWARQHGVMDLGEWGTPDKAANLLKLQSQFNTIASDQQAARVARAFPNGDEMLMLRDLAQTDPEAYRGLIRSRQFQTSKEGRVGAAQTETLKRNVSAFWDRLNWYGGMVARFWLMPSTVGREIKAMAEARVQDQLAAAGVTGSKAKASMDPNLGVTNPDQGWMGGNARSRGSMPAGMKGIALSENLESEAIRLGAFSVG